MNVMSEANPTVVTPRQNAEGILEAQRLTFKKQTFLLKIIDYFVANYKRPTYFVTFVPYKKGECKFNTIGKLHNKLRKLKCNYLLVKEYTKDNREHYHALIDKDLEKVKFKNMYVHIQDLHKNFIIDHTVIRVNEYPCMKHRKYNSSNCATCWHVENMSTHELTERGKNTINKNNHIVHLANCVRYILKTQPKKHYSDYIVNNPGYNKLA